MFIKPIRHCDGGGGETVGGLGVHIVPVADSFVCCGSIRDLEKAKFSENW